VRVNPPRKQWLPEAASRLLDCSIGHTAIIGSTRVSLAALTAPEKFALLVIVSPVQAFTSLSLVAQRGFTHPHRPVTLLHGFQALARKREGYYTRGAFMRRWSGKTLKPTNMLRGSFFYAHRKSMRGNSVEHVTRDNPSMQSAGAGALLNRTLGDRVGAQIYVALHRQGA